MYQSLSDYLWKNLLIVCRFWWFKIKLLHNGDTDIKKRLNRLRGGRGRSSVLFSSITQLCPTLCNPMDCSTPDFPVLHQLPELSQTHGHQFSDAIQPSHPLLSPSPSTFNLSQHQGLFEWVSSSHQMTKVLEFQLQHQSFQWIFRTDFL